jgi:hypothetical protein
MSDSEAAGTGKGHEGSLWTTPASSASTLTLAGVDQSVSADQIRKALEAAKERATTFTGKVSDDVLRAIVGG